jgi:hypothetical protein
VNFIDTSVRFRPAAEALPGVLMHTLEGVKAITEWAGQGLYSVNVIKDSLPGAKKAIGLAKALPND